MKSSKVFFRGSYAVPATNIAINLGIPAHPKLLFFLSYLNIKSSWSILFFT